MIKLSQLPVNGTVNHNIFFKVKVVKIQWTITILIILHEEPGKSVTFLLI